MRNALWQRGQWVQIPNLSIHIGFTPSFILFLLIHDIDFMYSGRVHIQEQLEEWRGEVPLADQRMITTVVGTTMMEGHAFFRMEGAHEITTKISGVTMVKMCISLLNAELVHRQEEWEHTFYRKRIFCVTLIIVLWVEALIQQIILKQKIILVFNVSLPPYKWNINLICFRWYFQIFLKI